MEQIDDKRILSELKSFFGFDKFKGLQEEVIRNLLKGNDTFVIMPTGGGKSLCYQLPALICEGTAIIISPLIALMKNQVDGIRGFSTNRGIAHFLNSSLNKTEIQKVKDDVLSGVTKMLYVAPESLTKEDNILFLKNAKISLYAIDEAHCISEWGHDFRPEYRRIRTIIEEIGHAPIIALTATATPKVQLDILKNIGIVNATVFKSSFNRPNLYYEIRPKTTINKDIVKYIKENEGKSGIIYCLSRRKVEELAELLQVNGIKAVPYHAGLDANTRAENQDKFLMEDVDIIVATIAFGMGIDKPDVRYVIHYDIPKSLEGYYQETGRAGRDGGEGNCIAFYDYKDIEKLEKLLKGKTVAEQEIGKHLLMEVVSYAESSICRRIILLHYFGEIVHEKNCNSCDNCLKPKERFEGMKDVQLLLKTIQILKEQHIAKHIVNVIFGIETSDVKNFKHDQLPIFGTGNDGIKDIKYWNAVVRQSIVGSFLIKDIENYGVLKLSDKGKDFIVNPHNFELAYDHDYEKLSKQKDDDDNDRLLMNYKTGASDEVLFNLLKNLRKEIAKKFNLPPFVIFQDTSLADMTIQYPITVDELKNITGVGSGKAIKYGQTFVELIKKYVEENEIQRPQDIVVKSVVNKSGLKVFLIQSIDRKRMLEDMAEAKGISMAELITELEAIVSSGTKLDISYYIEANIDEDTQDLVYDYFYESETDSIEDAVKEIGESTDEETIRLLRLKFMSEYGN